MNRKLRVEPPGRIERIIKPVNGIVQPPVIAPPERPGRNTNQLNFLSQNAMKAVWIHKMSPPFRNPVDAKKLNIPDYHKLIKRPMDLSTIKKRLANQYYWSSSEAIADFKLMFENCYAYNDANHEIVSMAKTLEKLFFAKIAQMPREEVEIVEQRKNATKNAILLTPPPKDEAKKSRKRTVSFASNDITILPVTRNSERKQRTLARNNRKQNPPLLVEAISPTESPANDHIENSDRVELKERIESRMENDPQEHHRLEQIDRLSEVESIDSGIGSIPANDQMAIIRTFGTQLNMLRSDVQKLLSVLKNNSHAITLNNDRISNCNY